MTAGERPRACHPEARRRRRTRKLSALLRVAGSFAVADASMIVGTTEIEFRISNEELRIEKGDSADDHSQFFIRNSKFEIRNSISVRAPELGQTAGRPVSQVAYG